MSGRLFDECAREPAAGVVFRYPRNWTAVAFFGALGVLHLSMAATALWAYRSEAHMSVIFGLLFVGVAACCALARQQVSVDPGRRRIGVRRGVGRIVFDRWENFSDVSCVRVTVLGRNDGESSVTIVSAGDEIELPPTRTPRQTGLLLAMTMGVRLVKVYGEGSSPDVSERIARLYRNEDAER